MIRSVNRGLILAALEASSQSRADIAKSTGLNKATVSSQVAELIEAGLVVETGIGPAELGRKPLLLELDGGAAYAAGVALAPRSFRLTIRDLAGKERLARDCSLPAPPSAETAVEAIGAALDRALAELPRPRYGLAGLGLSVPGVVEAEGGMVLRATSLGWEGVSVREPLARRCGCPVWVGNDAKLAAAAERIAGGRGKCEEELLCLIVGEGIGLGAYLGGELYAGPRGYFGEAGHLPFVAGGRPCSCGNRGCWAAYASETALAADLAAALGESAPLPFERIVELGSGPDPRVGACLSDYAGALAGGIAGLVNLFSPNALVLASELLEALPRLFAELRDRVAAQAMDFNRGCELRLSALGRRAPAIGAALAARDRFIEAAIEDPGRLGSRSAP